jgi:hypothetical protein
MISISERAKYAAVMSANTVVVRVGSPIWMDDRMIVAVKRPLIKVYVMMSVLGVIDLKCSVTRRKVKGIWLSYDPW